MLNIYVIIYSVIVILQLGNVKSTESKSKVVRRDAYGGYRYPDWGWGHFDRYVPITKKESSLTSTLTPPSNKALTSNPLNNEESTSMFIDRRDDTSTSKLIDRKDDTSTTMVIDDTSTSASIASSDETTTSTSFPPFTEENKTMFKLCDPYNATLPDFSAPGRRLSETKCYEHIWTIKDTQIRRDRSKFCNPFNIPGRTTTFVVGGREAKIGEFPHMAALGWKARQGSWIFKCGGSLISSKFVITAAHCTNDSNRDTSVADPIPKIVRLGDKNISDKFQFISGSNPIDVNISRIIKHPNYSSPIQYYDIALLELEKELKFSDSILPACLWHNFDTSPLGTKAFVTGWGVIKSGTLKTVPDLQAAEVDIIDTNYCDELLESQRYRNWMGFQSHQLCAGTLAGGVDTCQGDSGGPLQVKIPLPNGNKWAIHYVVGVTSFGYRCGRVNTPGVYSRVSSFLDWIESTVWPEEYNRQRS